MYAPADGIQLDVEVVLRSKGIEDISVDAGWFPTSLGRTPKQEDLLKLSETMGGGAAGVLSPPPTWSVLADPLLAEMHPLPEGPEKASVVAAFSKTVSRGVRVRGVERIQNMSMWQSYAVKRQTILMREKQGARVGALDRDPEASRFERIWPFHGTNAEVVD